MRRRKRRRVSSADWMLTLIRHASIRTSNESSPGLHSRSVYPRAMRVAKGAMQTAFAIAPASIKADANVALD